jgi:FkbM family methyltransferase
MDPTATQQCRKGFSLTNGLRSGLARKRRAVRRVQQREGFAVLLWEVLNQGLKPLVKVYESVVWRWKRAGGRMCFNVHGHVVTVLPGDKGISRELSIYQTHEPLATRLLQQFLKPGMNVVDIGGNLGYYALLEAHTVGDTGRVIAIEPVAVNFDQLSKNVEANGYRNILLHNVAIGASNGTAPMYLSEKSNWHSLHRTARTTREITVRVSTLDALLAQHQLPSVDLIRMDLEGYEVEVIQGMAETVENYSPRLLVELHPHVVGAEAMLEYLRQLEAYGYELDWAVDNERDRPIRWRFLREEKLSLKELLTDPRMSTDARTLMVLLARKVEKRFPLTRASGTLAETVFGAHPPTPSE